MSGRSIIIGIVLLMYTGAYVAGGANEGQRARAKTLRVLGKPPPSLG